MAAEFISIWGSGYLGMSDEEFATARSQGYTGPQRSLLIMEIGEELTDLEAISAQVNRISGAMGATIVHDDKMRVMAKVLKLKVDGLKEQLRKFRVKIPQAPKAELQALLSEHLSANGEHRAEFLADTELEASHEFLKGYCRNEHIVAQVIIVQIARSAFFILKNRNNICALF